MSVSRKLICLSFIVGAAFAWMELVPDNEVVDCTPGGTSEFLDVSEVEIIMESDDDFFVNGTIKFLKPINAPWKARGVGERWIRDQWVSGAEKKVDDLCETMHDDLDPGYPFFKDQKSCPLEAGDVWAWNMKKIPLDTFAYFPPHLAGKWRVLGTTFVEENGITKLSCMQLSGYLFQANKPFPFSN